MRSCAVQHTNYNTDMATTGIIGIYDLDKEVNLFSERMTTTKMGTYFLRGTLYTATMSKK